MSSVHAVPLLLSVLVGLSLGLVAWGFWRARSHEVGDALMETQDEFLFALLMLAVLAFSVFVVYLLLSGRF